MTEPAASPAPRTTPAGAAATSSPTVPAALQRVLAAEHAAVYGYPVAGVRLTEPGQVQRARELESAHRQVRDDLMAQLTRLGLTPVGAQPVYRPPEARTGTAPATRPEPRTDPIAAARSAVLLEEGCADAYRYLLTAAVAAGGQQLAVRTQALSGLAAAAAAATTWRALATPAKPTVAFPGL